jgi:hypothetical protein
MLDPAEPPVPIMLKHPILERIDAISRDAEKVAAMRDLLHGNADACALADVAVRHGIVSRPLADQMLRTWANVGGGGWLGDILQELRRGVLAAADVLLASRCEMSSWWVMGLTTDFRIVLAPSDDRLLLFMSTPKIPPILGAAKNDPLALDPGFRPLLIRLRAEVDGLLAIGGAQPPG